MPKALKIILFVILLFPSVIQSQTGDNLPDKLPDDLNQEQWEAVRDLYVIEAIKMLARIDTLNLQIDSMSILNESLSKMNCTDELYAIVGASKDEVESFRSKFTETEKRVKGRIGTPGEAHKFYFDEIAASKIKCLPEFYERFAKMKNILTEYHIAENMDSSLVGPGNYSVVKGDCLWRISQSSYNNPYLWPAIWDANRITIANPESFEDFVYRKISDPNFIYPGQVLKIPSLNDESRKEAEERSRNFRRIRNKSKD